MCLILTDIFQMITLYFFVGFLTECYDELGNRYQVPVYCLSYPINIVKEGSGRDSPIEQNGKPFQLIIC